MVSKKRNINIELLRIVSMLMIVYHHFSIHSIWGFSHVYSNRTYMITTIGNFGKVGVILFVLIFGYFLDKQTFKIKKVIALNNIARFYGLLILIILIYLNQSVLSKKDFFRAIFPAESELYWFLTAYIVLLVLQPFFKYFFVNKKREDILKQVVVALCVIYLPNILGIVVNLDGFFVPNVYVMFIFISFVGYLLKLYQEELLNHYYRYTVIIMLASLALILAKPLIVNELQGYFYFPDHFLTGVESLNALIFSSSLFLVCLKLPVNRWTWLVSIAPLTFDIYLIHDNPILRSRIWNDLFENKQYLNSKWLILVIVVEPIIVFIVCLLIAKVRAMLFAFFAFLRIRWNLFVKK